MEKNTNDELTSTPALQRSNNTSGKRKPATKNGLTHNDLKWEENHAAISNATLRLINKKNRIPLKSEIARESGLNRKTVVKHMTEQDSRCFFDQQLQHFNYLGGQVLAKVFQTAMQGDMRAAKLYFDILHKQAKTASQANTFIAHNENSVKVNEMIINQAALNNLPYEKLRRIEDILLEERLYAEEQERIRKIEERYGFNRVPEAPEGIDEIQERLAAEQAAEDEAEEAEKDKPENINNELLRMFDDRSIEKRLLPDGLQLEEEDDFYTRTRREILRRREEAQRKNELKE